MTDAAAAAPRFQIGWVFLLVAIAVNLLFVWGMWSAAPRAGGRLDQGAELAALQLHRHGPVLRLHGQAVPGGRVRGQAVGGAELAASRCVPLVLCVAMIILNWIAFFAA
jgi:hypothetical protein